MNFTNIKSRFLTAFICFLIGTVWCAAQNITPVFLSADSLGENGFRFQDPVKYHIGDHQEWADPLFNDASWDTINPILNLGELTEEAPRGRGRGPGTVGQEKGRRTRGSKGAPPPGPADGPWQGDRGGQAYAYQIGNGRGPGDRPGGSGGAD